jgi:hypothetical protein
MENRKVKQPCLGVGTSGRVGGNKEMVKEGEHGGSIHA